MNGNIGIVMTATVVCHGISLVPPSINAAELFKTRVIRLSKIFLLVIFIAKLIIIITILKC